MAGEYSRTLEQIAKPFIESGIYASTDAFVSNLVKDVSARKIREYERKIRAFEAKYGSFDEFTRKIRGKASPKQEDRWMEWEAAINMLNAWKRVACELASFAS
ncbi:MAG: hypothetical protein ACFCUE_01000 [Candidatus Bathyarchaeia archaeon]|jgi:hypothetical protein